jgi:alpha-L-rhamnosidase
MTQIAQILGRTEDADRFRNEATSAHQEFADEYVSTNGRLVSDTQTAYALAICFDLLSPSQTAYAGKRLSEVVNGNKFNIGTGFAGTPFVCEALAKTGHIDVAYAMLLNEKCPSWLYPLTKGATTMWERWDSMLPDGSVNPGEMTSFNHYAFGAVAEFMVERLAGLRCLEPGWRRTRFEPEMEGPFTWAMAEHLTPYGKVSGSWSLSACGDGDTEGFFDVKIDVVVPPTTEMEVVVPGQGHDVKVVGSGQWSFTGRYKKRCAWPVAELSTLSF